jgi:hypothetical protein
MGSLTKWDPSSMMQRIQAPCSSQIHVLRKKVYSKTPQLSNTTFNPQRLELVAKGTQIWKLTDLMPGQAVLQNLEADHSKLTIKDAD